MMRLTIGAPAAPAEDATHCVVYRLGYRYSPRWYRTVPMPAVRARQIAEHMPAGRSARVAVWTESTAGGLPTDWDAPTVAGEIEAPRSTLATCKSGGAPLILHVSPE